METHFFPLYNESNKNMILNVIFIYLKRRYTASIRVRKAVDIKAFNQLEIWLQ